MAQRSVVDQNETTGQIDPVFVIRTSDDQEIRGNRVVIEGSSEMKYDSAEIFGRRVWLETYSKVILYHGNVVTGIFPAVELF